MGLCYRTSLWIDRLWSEHLELSEAARTLVQQGIDKQGSQFPGFPSDLHARLYLPNNPEAVEPTPESAEWAIHLHTLAAELGEWQQLRLMCARNGFAAGIAAEAMLEQLLPHVPQRPPAPPTQHTEHTEPMPHAEPAGSTPQRSQEAADSSSPTATPPDPARDLQQPLRASDAEVRAALRRATRAARDAVQQAEAGLEGVSTPLGLSMPGTAVVPTTGPANLKDIRRMYQRLQGSHRLKRIAELAGRLERMAANKARSKVKPGVGEVHGIGLGGLADLARLLPSELIALRRPVRRLHLLARLLQQQALVYAMSGKEPCAHGPIVVLLDESASMRDEAKGIWAAAVALSILSTATRQGRSWALAAFNGAITREVTIPAGKATPNDICRALDHRPAGGTCFTTAIGRAIDIINKAPAMKKADVVVITDGEDELESETVDKATALTRTEGVSWFVVGVGPDAEASIQSLAPIATSMVRIRQTNDDAADLVAPVINLERSNREP